MLAHWREDDIFDQVAARMGYRLVLERAAWTQPAPGSTWSFKLTVRNDGFSRLKRRYDVVLVLRRGGRSKEWPLGFDLRTVATGSSVTFTTAELAEFPAGRWRLGVAVRDPALPERPKYAIRFANELDFDGVNWLGVFELAPPGP